VEYLILFIKEIRMIIKMNQYCFRSAKLVAFQRQKLTTAQTVNDAGENRRHAK